MLDGYILILIIKKIEGYLGLNIYLLNCNGIILILRVLNLNWVKKVV